VTVVMPPVVAMISGHGHRRARGSDRGGAHTMLSVSVPGECWTPGLRTRCCPRLLRGCDRLEVPIDMGALALVVTFAVAPVLVMRVTLRPAEPPCGCGDFGWGGCGGCGGGRWSGGNAVVRS
jgi:hypothetical protein